MCIEERLNGLNELTLGLLFLHELSAVVDLLPESPIQLLQV